MKAIHLANAARRDAQVAIDRNIVKGGLRSVLPDGQEKTARRLVKNTLLTEWDALLERYGGEREALERALVASDPEVEVETAGRYLARTRRVYVSQQNAVVYRLNLYQVVHGADGGELERRDINKVPPNIDAEQPLVWTGRKFRKADAVRRFVFSRSYQLRHINGVTFDFLFNMAKELHGSRSLMLIGGGSKGAQPVILARGGQPYRAFLEGRVDGGCYALILHLSDIELKELEES